LNGKINFIETVYIENGFSFDPNCEKDSGLVIGEITSKDESFKIMWDEKAKEIILGKKDKNQDWQNPNFILYHQKKIDNKDNRYSVTIGDRNGKMLFKGTFEFLI
jgi:hypothetical protein